MTTAPVHSITDEQIADIEALAKKATQGEWWIDSHGHRMSADDGAQTVFITDDRMGKATRHPETGNLSHWPNDWDASYIATACPANIIALITRLREAEKDAARYQWLRDDATNLDGWSPAVAVTDGSYVGYCLDGRDLDNAIDTAMQEHTQ